MLCCTSRDVQDCPVHKNIAKKQNKYVSKTNSYQIEEADSVNESLLTVDSATTDITLVDTFLEDAHTKLIEHDKTNATDLVSTKSEINSDLSFKELWSEALTHVYGVEIGDAGDKDEEEISTGKVVNDLADTSEDDDETVMTSLNQPRQRTSEKVSETKSLTNGTENEDITLEGAANINQRTTKQDDTSSNESPECEKNKLIATSADVQTPDDAVHSEKARTEVPLVQSLKTLCSVVFARNDLMKKGVSNSQQNETQQKENHEKDEDLENDSGIAISDTNQDPGKETTEIVAKNLDSRRENTCLKAGIQNSEIGKETSSTKEMLQTQGKCTTIDIELENQAETKSTTAGAVEKVITEAHAENSCFENTDTITETETQTTSPSEEKNDGFHTHDSSDTHFLIRISSGEDNANPGDIDYDIDITDAYDVSLAHETEQNREANKGQLKMINDTRLNLKDDVELNMLQMQVNDSHRDIDMISDPQETKDPDIISENIRRESETKEQSVAEHGDIPRPKMTDNTSSENADAVAEVIQTSTKHQHLSAVAEDVAHFQENDFVECTGVSERTGIDTVENVAAQRITAKLALPLPFRNQFSLDNCRVKTFKTRPQDKHLLMVELEIDYRIDTEAQLFKDEREKPIPDKEQMHQQSCDEIFSNRTEVKQMATVPPHFGLGARPKIGNLSQYGKLYLFF